MKNISKLTLSLMIAIFGILLYSCTPCDDGESDDEKVAEERNVTVLDSVSTK